MLTELHEPSEKKLMVVFQNKRAIYIGKHGFCGHDEEKVNLEIPEKKSDVVTNIIPEQPMENEVDIICAKLEKARLQKEKKIVSIVNAVRIANQQENLVTDKFIEDVETMVTCFKSELDKMQELFGRIIKKWPRVHLDFAVTSC